MLNNALQATALTVIVSVPLHIVHTVSLKSSETAGLAGLFSPLSVQCKTRALPRQTTADCDISRQADYSLGQGPQKGFNTTCQVAQTDD